MYVFDKKYLHEVLRQSACIGIFRLLLMQAFNVIASSVESNPRT